MKRDDELMFYMECWRDMQSFLPDCRCAGSCASRYNRLPSEKVRSDAARKAYRKKMQKEGKRDG